jgi:predicted Zn-dependent protease
VLERAPDNNHCRSMFSIVLSQLGEVAEGVAQAERALAADPGDGRVMYNAACTFTHAGQHDRAIATLRELVRTHPGFPREWPVRDPDLAALRDRPDFLEALAPAGSQRA